MNTKRVLAVLAAAVLLGPGSAGSGFAQNIDPFYLRSLKEGEGHFQAKRYVQAAESLELAAFGLFPGKDQLARARVLLALAYAHLNESVKAEQNLKSAQVLLGAEGLRSFVLPEPDRTDLTRLLRLFGLGQAGPAPAPAPPKASAEAARPNRGETPDAKPKPAEDGLVDAVRREPRAAGPAYALSDRQLEAGDPAAAKATLARLLENNPAEIRARLEIGRIEYGERRLKDAEKSLEKFLALSGSVSVDRRLVLQAKSFLALSAYLRGDARKSRTALVGAPELAEPAVRAGLGLSPEDQERLARLLQPQADR